MVSVSSFSFSFSLGQLFLYIPHPSYHDFICLRHSYCYTNHYYYYYKSLLFHQMSFPTKPISENIVDLFFFWNTQHATGVRLKLLRKQDCVTSKTLKWEVDWRGDCEKAGAYSACVSIWEEKNSRWMWWLAGWLALQKYEALWCNLCLSLITALRPCIMYVNVNISEARERCLRVIVVSQEG